MCLKCESGSRRFQPGEGPSRGLLRDYETSDGPFLKHYSTPVPVADKSRLKCGPSSAFLHFSASNIVLFRVGVLSQDFTHSSDERFKFNALL